VVNSRYADRGRELRIKKKIEVNVKPSLLVGRETATSGRKAGDEQNGSTAHRGQGDEKKGGGWRVL